MEGNHTTAVSSINFPDVLSRARVQERLITGFIQDWDFARSIEGQWKRGIDVVMRIESLPTEYKNDRDRMKRSWEEEQTEVKGFKSA